MSPTADWEQCFLPLDNPNAIQPPRSEPMVMCKHCGHQALDPKKAEHRQFWNGRRYVSYYFCNQEHLEQWYISQLNTVGM